MSKIRKNTTSVNCCTNCRKNLTLTADLLGMKKCADCNYLNTIGVYSVKDYNDWLRK